MTHETPYLKFLLSALMLVIAMPVHAQDQPTAADATPPVQVFPDALDPSQPADVPLPNPLTYFEVQETTKTVTHLPSKMINPGPRKNDRIRLSQPLPPEEPKASDQTSAPVNAVAPVNAPIPPVRPQTLHASEDFIKKARDLAEEEEKNKPAPPAAKPKPPAKPQIKTVKAKIVEIPAKPMPKRTGKTQVTEANLVKPTLQDILKSIDPEAAKQNVAVKDDGLSLGYKAGVIELPQNIKDILAAGMLTRLKSDPANRLEILSYASAGNNDESDARRISLQRAQAVKEFLVEKGIESKRIDIRPMGLSAPTTRQPDHVDLQILKP